MSWIHSSGGGFVRGEYEKLGGLLVELFSRGCGCRAFSTHDLPLLDKMYSYLRSIRHKELEIE